MVFRKLTFVTVAIGFLVYASTLLVHLSMPGL